MKPVRKHPPEKKNHLELIFGEGGYNGEGPLLELGFGPDASVAERLLNMEEFRGSYFGYDQNRASVRKAREQYSENFRFNFFHDDTFNSMLNPEGFVSSGDFILPFRSDFFEAALVSGTFLHMYPHDVANQMREIGRVLAPGSQAVMQMLLMTPQAKHACLEGDLSDPFPIHKSFDGSAYVADRDLKEMLIGFDPLFVNRICYESGLGVIMQHPGDWWSKDNQDPDLLRVIKRRSFD